MAGIVDSLTRSHGLSRTVPKPLGRSRKAGRCRHQISEKAKRGTSPDPLGIQRTSAPGTRWPSGHLTILIDMQIIAQRASTAPNRRGETFLMLFLNMRPARLSKQRLFFLLSPREDVTGHPVRQVVRNLPCDNETFREHDTGGCATAQKPRNACRLARALRERTCARLVSFSKPRGTFCGLEESLPCLYV